MLRATVELTQVADGHDFADAEGPIPVGVPHPVDPIPLHDDEGVGQGGQLHEVLDASRPVRAVELALGWIEAEGLGDELRVRVRGEADPAAQYLSASTLVRDGSWTPGHGIADGSVGGRGGAGRLRRRQTHTPFYGGTRC
jgi:hypothetical protein